MAQTLSDSMVSNTNEIKKNVEIKVVLENNYHIENIRISDALCEFLKKEPVCGRSDYSDLPGANINRSWRSFSEFTLGDSPLRLSSNRSHSQDLEKRNEARIRQRARRQQITLQREERRLKQKLQQQERRRQKEIVKNFQESYMNTEIKSGVIISSSPKKYSPVKYKDDRDAYLYEKFKMNLTKKCSLTHSPDKKDCYEGRFKNIKKKKNCKRKLTGKYSVHNVGMKKDIHKIEKEKPMKEDSHATQKCLHHDSSCNVTLSKHLKTDLNEAASESMAIKKINRTIPEVADADSSTPHVVARTTRKRKIINYEEFPDEDIEDEDNMFSVDVEKLERKQCIKDKCSQKQTTDVPENFLLDTLFKTGTDVKGENVLNRSVVGEITDNTETISSIHVETFSINKPAPMNTDTTLSNSSAALSGNSHIIPNKTQTFDINSQNISFNPRLTCQLNNSFDNSFVVNLNESTLSSGMIQNKISPNSLIPKHTGHSTLNSLSPHSLTSRHAGRSTLSSVSPHSVISRHTGHSTLTSYHDTLSHSTSTDGSNKLHSTNLKSSTLSHQHAISSNNVSISKSSYISPINHPSHGPPNYYSPFGETMNCLSPGHATHAQPSFTSSTITTWPLISESDHLGYKTVNCEPSNSYIHSPKTTTNNKSDTSIYKSGLLSSQGYPHVHTPTPMEFINTSLQYSYPHYLSKFSSVNNLLLCENSCQPNNAELVNIDSWPRHIQKHSSLAKFMDLSDTVRPTTNVLLSLPKHPETQVQFPIYPSCNRSEAQPQFPRNPSCNRPDAQRQLPRYPSCNKPNLEKFQNRMQKDMFISSGHLKSHHFTSNVTSSVQQLYTGIPSHQQSHGAIAGRPGVRLSSEKSTEVSDFLVTESISKPRHYLDKQPESNFYQISDHFIQKHQSVSDIRKRYYSDSTKEPTLSSITKAISEDTAKLNRTSTQVEKYVDITSATISAQETTNIQAKLNLADMSKENPSASGKTLDRMSTEQTTLQHGHISSNNLKLTSSTSLNNRHVKQECNLIDQDRTTPVENSLIVNRLQSSQEFSYYSSALKTSKHSVQSSSGLTLAVPEKPSSSFTKSATEMKKENFPQPISVSSIPQPSLEYQPSLKKSTSSTSEDLPADFQSDLKLKMKLASYAKTNAPSNVKFSSVFPIDFIDGHTISDSNAVTNIVSPTKCLSTLAGKVTNATSGESVIFINNQSVTDLSDSTSNNKQKTESSQSNLDKSHCEKLLAHLNTQEITNVSKSKSLCVPQVAVIVAPPVITQNVMASEKHVPLSAWHISNCNFNDCDDILQHNGIAEDTDMYTVTVSLPSVNKESVQEPDLSLIKSEDTGLPISLHLKEVIDLSLDTEDIFLQDRDSATVSQNKININMTSEFSNIQDQISENIKYDSNIFNLKKTTNDICKVASTILTSHHISSDSSNTSTCHQVASDSSNTSPSCHQIQLHLSAINDSYKKNFETSTGMPIAQLSSNKRFQQVISKIASWTTDEVHNWLKSHHMDKICPNLSDLDGDGLQRLALQYMHDPDSFYSSVKKRLGLSIFQTLVICRGMKELTEAEDIL